MKIDRKEAKTWAREHLWGFYEAPMTPLTADFQIDEAALRDNVEKYIDMGVDGLVVGGFVAEVWNMSYGEWHRYHAIIAEAAAGRIPLWTIILEPSVHEALKRLEFVQKLGYVGAEVMNPSVQLRAPDEIVEWFAYLSDHCDMPLVLYRTPISGTLMDVDTVRRLADMDTIVGVKQGSFNRGDTFVLRRICHPDFVVSDPFERFFLDDLRHGGQVLWAAFWYIAFGKLRPHVRRYYELARQGQWEAAYSEWEKLEPARGYFDELAANMARTGTYANHLSMMKPWMEAIGIQAGPVRPPVRAVDPQRAEAVVSKLKELGVA